MASPRVFISSTCYDLSEVRDSLIDFVKSFGFDPILSDRGDVFYHPDIHTHDSCLNEISNCQLFILIIGGRFGGNYIADDNKSIVNAEYSAAREKKIPIFTFVKKDVHSDHHVFLKNKKNPALKEIIFPSIDNNAHANKIFSFIDEVRLAPTNNGYFPFDFARDIAALLRKQWAGMFFDFLEERNAQNQLRAATGLLKSISVAGEKVEELVKSLYRHIDAAGAEAKIDNVEKRAIARQFYDEAISQFIRESLKGDLRISLAATPKEGKWYEYIAKATKGKLETMSFDRDGVEQDITAIDWGHCVLFVDCPENPEDFLSVRSIKLQHAFEVIKTLNKEELKDILNDLEFLNLGPTTQSSGRAKRPRR